MAHTFDIQEDCWAHLSFHSTCSRLPFSFHFFAPKRARKCDEGWRGHVADGASETGASEPRERQRRGWVGREELRRGWCVCMGRRGGFRLKPDD